MNLVVYFKPNYYMKYMNGVPSIVYIRIIYINYIIRNTKAYQSNKNDYFFI